MIWLNLLIVVVLSGYAQWLVYRGWCFLRDLSQATAAEQILKTVLNQRHFYFLQAIGGLIALTLFLGVKSLLLLFTLPEPTAFTAFVFGNFAGRFLIVKLGCLGIGLLAIFLACFYQFIKSKHYFDVLYALRGPLQLGTEFKIARGHPAAPVPQHQMV